MEKNSLTFSNEKNISRSNFENLVGQFLDDMLVKIAIFCTGNFYTFVLFFV